MSDNKRFLTSEQQHRIEQIWKQLQDSVSLLELRNWLENFRHEDYDGALTILENMKYFTVSEIIHEFDMSLQKILTIHRSIPKFFILGAGELGKSGPTFIYFIKQTPTFRKNESRFKILSHPNKLKSQGLKENDYLIFVDDIIGSGESLVKFFKTEIYYQLLKDSYVINILLLCVVYMEDALTYIGEEIEKVSIFGSGYRKAFASGSSVFGYRPKMLPIRQIAYDFKTKEKIYHPLGYKGAQSLIAFAHSVPNNTIPIIWSDRQGWYPLYPRSSFTKIDRLKQFRKDSWLEYSHMDRTKTLEKRSENGVYNHSINFMLFGIIKLKKRKSIVPIICQILGITMNTLDELIQEGIKSGLFDASGNLTSFAEQTYEGVLQSNRMRQSRIIKKPDNLNRTDVYLPKIFLGKT
jgi:hypothetical protein